MQKEDRKHQSPIQEETAAYAQRPQRSKIKSGRHVRANGREVQSLAKFSFACTLSIFTGEKKGVHGSAGQSLLFLVQLLH